MLLLLLLLLSILSKDTGSTKGKPVRGACEKVDRIGLSVDMWFTYIHVYVDEICCNDDII